MFDGELESELVALRREVSDWSFFFVKPCYFFGLVQNPNRAISRGKREDRSHSSRDRTAIGVKPQ